MKTMFAILMAVMLAGCGAEVDEKIYGHRISEENAESAIKLYLSGNFYKPGYYTLDCGDVHPGMARKSINDPFVRGYIKSCIVGDKDHPSEETEEHYLFVFNNGLSVFNYGHLPAKHNDGEWLFN